MSSLDSTTLDVVLEANFDSVFLTDGAGVIQKVNKVALKTFGYETKEQILGQSISKVIGGPHAKYHHTYFQGISSQEQIKEVLGRMRDVRAKRQDGSEFFVQVGIQMLEGREGFLAFCHDLSRHKQQTSQIEQASEDVLAKERVSRAVLDASLDSVILVDEEGTIVDMNEATLSIFCYESPEDMIGSNIRILVGGGHDESHSAYMSTFHKRGGKSTLLGTKRELLARRKDGTEFPCQIGVKKVPQSSLLVGFIRDITHEKEAANLAAEKRTAEELLLNMLPHEIVERLKGNPTHIADHFTDATVLFADIVGFTSMSNRLEPLEVVTFLNDIFSRFDACLDRYGLNKIKTIGDCYMVTNIPGRGEAEKKCAAVCHFALDMIEELKDYNRNSEHELNMRIGINVGPVVAGVVGTKRFLYDIWGDAVNIASRMESSGVPGRVQVTQSVVDAIASTSITHEKRGSVQVKGIGEMETYFLVGRDKGGNLQFQLSENDLRVSPKRHQSELLDVLRTLEDLDLDDLSSSCNFDNNASFRSSMHQSALDGITEE